MEDDFMASLLGDLEGQATVKKTDSPRPAAAPVRRAKQSLVKTAVTSAKRQADIDASSFRSNDVFATSSDPLSSDPTFTGTPSSDPFDSATKKARFDSSMDQWDEDMGGMDATDQSWDDFQASAGGAAESSKSGGDVKMEEDDDDDLLVKKPSNGAAKPKGPAQRRQLVNASAIRPGQPKREPTDDATPATPTPSTSFDIKPKSKGLDWRTATSSLAFSSAPVSTTDEPTDDSTSFNEEHKNVIRAGAVRATAAQCNALESDGSLRFWWFDYDEPSPGVVRLVGKVRVQGETVKVVSTAEGKKVEKEVPKYVSATVVVKGIKRKLYVLPKTKAECAFSLLHSVPSFSY
jgi:DNA polymerase alpha subunit A